MFICPPQAFCPKSKHCEVDLCKYISYRWYYHYSCCDFILFYILEYRMNTCIFIVWSIMNCLLIIRFIFRICQNIWCRIQFKSNALSYFAVLDCDHDKTDIHKQIGYFIVSLYIIFYGTFPEKNIFCIFYIRNLSQKVLISRQL